MYERLNAPDNVMAFGLSGLISGEDIDQYQKQMHEKLDKHERIGVCIDFTGLSDLDHEALTKGAKADLDFLTHVRQVDRMAMVSDKQWPRAILGWYQALLPGVEAEVFTPAQREQAMDWASQVDGQTSDQQGPAVRALSSTGDNVFAFAVNGVINPEDLAPFIEQFDRFLEGHESIRLLNRVECFGGIDPSVFLQSGLLSMKFAAIQKVERYAIVGAPGWMEKIAAAVNPMFPSVEIRTFPADREAEAWDWLGAKPAE